jgi:hypothetical protein
VRHFRFAREAIAADLSGKREAAPLIAGLIELLRGRDPSSTHDNRLKQMTVGHRVLTERRDQPKLGRGGRCAFSPPPRSSGGEPSAAQDEDAVGGELCAGRVHGPRKTLGLGDNGMGARRN